MDHIEEVMDIHINMNDIGSLFTVMAVLLSSLFCGRMLWQWLKNERYSWGVDTKLPPGSAGFPLLGCTLRWYLSIRGSHPPAFVEYYAKRYGRIFRCSLLGRRTVISGDAKFNRFILQNEGRLVRASYPKSFRDLVGRNGLIAIHGDLHRKLHGIAAALMTTEKLKCHFFADIQVILKRAMQRWQEGPIFCEDECRKLAVSLMANQLLGAYTEEEINQISPHCSDFVDGILSFPINIPGTKYHKAMQARRTLISLICESIADRKNYNPSTSKSALLVRLLEKEKLSQEIVADFLISLLFAGHETTAKTMSFCIYFLTQNPRALEQLRAEQDSLRRKKNDDNLTWDDYESMKFTQWVVNETLRLGGIATSVFRETIEDINYNGYIIPKGWMVMPFFSAIHLNPGIYTDALAFNPWRWQEKETEKIHWRNSEVYTPYGAGARLCPGAELARLQICMFLHYFVTNFSWEQLGQDTASYFPSARLVARFPISVKFRSSGE